MAHRRITACTRVDSIFLDSREMQKESDHRREPSRYWLFELQFETRHPLISTSGPKGQLERNISAWTEGATGRIKKPTVHRLSADPMREARSWGRNSDAKRRCGRPHGPWLARWRRKLDRRQVPPDGHAQMGMARGLKISRKKKIWTRRGG